MSEPCEASQDCGHSLTRTVDQEPAKDEVWRTGPKSRVRLRAMSVPTQRLWRASVFVGFSIALPALIQGRIAAGVLGFAIGSLGFGLVFFAFGHAMRRRLTNLGNLPDQLPVRPELLLRIDRPVDEVVGLVEQSMKELFGDVERCGPAEYRMVAITSKCWWKAIGEQVEVIVAPETESVSMVTISSRPRLSSVVLDVGHNFANVRRLQHALASSIGTSLVHFVRLDEAQQA